MIKSIHINEWNGIMKISSMSKKILRSIFTFFKKSIDNNDFMKYAKSYPW